MDVSTGLLTVEEFLHLPAPKEGHLELHHGEVVLVPPPKWGHQRIQAILMTLLIKLAREYAVRMEMAFRPSPEYEVWVADVGMVSSERAAATGDDEYLTGAPELVVEVLSPSNTVDEINAKMNVCMANGCLSFWVLDSKFRQISVTEGDLTRHYRGTASIACSLLDGDVSVADIWPA
jgi:Uma2 family endonuclease